MPRHTPPPDIDDDACEEVDCCSTCEQPEDDCCCSYCESCDERFEDGNGCQHGNCDYCHNCCDCEECTECCSLVFSHGEYHDNYCHDCGTCHDCCCCEDEDGDGNRCYSTNPITVFHFSARTDDFDPQRWRKCKPIKALHMQRFGIEIEKSHHNHADDITMNDIADRLGMWGLLDSNVTGYSVGCNDASLSGPRPAESKTCPLTFRDHQMCHYAYMMLGQKWPRDVWREHLEHYHSLSSFRQFNQFRRIYFDGGMDHRWQKDAKAWSNKSCGMHVNVSNTMTTEMTLYKVFLYIVLSHPSDMRHIGGRSTEEHYCRTHHGKSVWCDETDRPLDVCHFNYVHQAGVGSLKHQPASCNKHDAMSRRPWHGWELRLFRSSTNPMRILGNMQMVQLLCDYFQYVPHGDVARTGLGPIVRHSVFNRRTFPYAAGNFARQAELVKMVDLFKSHMRDVRRTPKKKR